MFEFHIYTGVVHSTFDILLLLTLATIAALQHPEYCHADLSTWPPVAALIEREEMPLADLSHETLRTAGAVAWAKPTAGAIA